MSHALWVPGSSHPDTPGPPSRSVMEQSASAVVDHRAQSARRCDSKMRGSQLVPVVARSQALSAVASPHGGEAGDVCRRSDPVTSRLGPRRRGRLGRPRNVGHGHRESFILLRGSALRAEWRPTRGAEIHGSRGRTGSTWRPAGLCDTAGVCRRPTVVWTLGP